MCGTFCSDPLGQTMTSHSNTHVGIAPRPHLSACREVCSFQDTRYLETSLCFVRLSSLVSSSIVLGIALLLSSRCVSCLRAIHMSLQSKLCV